MKTILYHTWEPGIEGNDNTSGGGTAWTKYLWKYFNSKGYNIYWFKENSDSSLSREWQPSSTIDVAIFCWRWKLSDNPRYKIRNMIYERQNALIEWCIENRVPFIVHDQDLKMTLEERHWLLSNGCKITTPSFYPNDDELSLHFPNPYKLERINSHRSDCLVYIGNDYERRDQTVRLIGGAFSDDTPTYFYGNWNESGPGRNPKEIQELLPSVSFMGRLPQVNIIKTLAKARATIMLHKEEYGPRGFTTIRWAEAASAGVLPFIPREFKLPSLYTTSLEPLRVSSSTELLDKYFGIDDYEENRLINEIRRLVKEYMTPEPWLNLIERIQNENLYT